VKITCCGIVVEIANRRHIAGTCDRCYWWDKQYESPAEIKGHCRRLAPYTDHHGRTLWPRTRSTQSCGQFRHLYPAPKAGAA
jgi:hypothetical protein